MPNRDRRPGGRRSRTGRDRHPDGRELTGLTFDGVKEPTSAPGIDADRSPVDLSGYASVGPDGTVYEVAVQRTIATEGGETVTGPSTRIEVGPPTGEEDDRQSAIVSGASPGR